MCSMMDRTGFRSLLIVMLLLVFGADGARAQQTGRITGRITEAETGLPLEGAAVVVVGTSLGVPTDADGRFLLAPVPTGAQTVRISYLGRETRTVQTTVAAGQTAVVSAELAAQAIALEGVDVIGARAMVQAEALNRQQNADNIMNVVASDQMGRFPDASAPEAVQRIPGVAVERDQGEGRYIQIRGGSAANTQVNFNGVQIPAPEGDIRQIALDAVPVELLEAVEVSKAILPWMDADAIGGSVNLVTRRAPAARLISAEVSGGFATIRDEPAFGGALTFGDRFMEDRLGMLFTGSYNRRDFGSDDLEPVWDLGDEGEGDDALEEMEVRHYTLTRERMGGTGTLDFRPSESSVFTLTGIYSRLEDDEQRRNLIHVLTDGEMIYSHRNRYEYLETLALMFDGEHALGGMSIDYTLGWTRSREDQPYQITGEFVEEGVAFDPDFSDPDAIQTNPSAGAFSGDFVFDELEEDSYDTRDADLMAMLNIALPYALGDMTGRLQWGAKVRDKNKERDELIEAIELAGGAADLILGQDIGEEWGESINHPNEYRQQDFATRPDELEDFRNDFAGSIEIEEDLEGQTLNYDLDERVIAGYVMTELNVTSRWMILPGLRYEQTTVNADGFELDAETETVAPANAERDYSNIFPALHTRFRLTDNTNLRGAYTSAIARPNFFDLVPFRITDGSDIVTGNPDLEATTSQNFDLLVEHYDQRIGVMSAGAFYKTLDQPIFLFTDENELGGETEQPRNGESGEIMGLELAYQQRLTFLPGLLSGLGAYANYTFTDSEAELPNGRSAALQGQSDHVGNLALSWERGGFTSQVSLNYHDDYVLEYADDAFEDIWVDNHLQLDLSAALRVLDTGTIFGELVNLTNEPFIAYAGTPDRPVQMEYYEPWGRIGFRMNW
jgi:TonB-dependent receptor